MVRFIVLVTLGAFLGGCTGAAGPGTVSPATIGLPLYLSRAVSERLAAPQVGPLNGETLTGTVTVRAGSYCHNEHDADGFFTASGTATGPYPGTFTASGHFWDVNDSGSFFIWGFEENFFITTSSGSIGGFVNVSAQYSGGPGPRIPLMRCLLFGPAGPRSDMRYSTVSVARFSSGSLRVDRIRNGRTFIEQFF